MIKRTSKYDSLSPGLKTHYPFFEGGGTMLFDCVGEKVGTLKNGATWCNTQRGATPLYDGSNDYAELPNPIGTIDKNTAFSMSIWVNALAYAPVGKNYLGRFAACSYSASGNFEFGITFGTIYNNVTGQQRLGSYTGKAYVASTVVSDNVSRSLNTWYHVVGTFNGVNAVQLFINGRLVASGAYNANCATSTANTSPLNNGGQYDGVGLASTYNLNCKTDDFRFYRGVISPTLVAQIFEKEKNKIR